MNKLGKPNLQDDDFYIPQSKESRKLLLKQYIAAKLKDDWLKLPKQQATMERRFLRKLIDSL